MAINDHDTLRRLNCELLKKHSKKAVWDAIDRALAAGGAKCIGDLHPGALDAIYKRIVNNLEGANG